MTKTYTINFDHNMVEKLFLDLDYYRRLTEDHFIVNDLPRNLRCATSFDMILSQLRLFGADTECGIYDDKGFDRIGYARINAHVFVKNGTYNPKELRDALYQIAGI